MNTYFSIEEASEGYYESKGSKFLSFAYPVSNEIEIKTYLQNNKVPSTNFPKLIYQVFALNGPVAIRNNNIDQRLQARLAEGLLDEVNQLLENGVLPEQLNYFGLAKYFVKQ